MVQMILLYRVVMRIKLIIANICLELVMSGIPQNVINEDASIIGGGEGTGIGHCLS